MEHLNIKIENVIIEVFETDDVLFIDAIIVDDQERGKGLGLKAIDTIKWFAQSKNKDVVCDASGYLGGDLNKLLTWYQRLGFKRENGIVVDADGYLYNYNCRLYIS